MPPSEWLCMSTKPGHTCRPGTSTERGGLGGRDLAHRRDRVALDRHVGGEGGRARPVDHGSAAEDEVEGRGRLDAAGPKGTRGHQGRCPFHEKPPSGLCRQGTS